MHRQIGWMVVAFVLLGLGVPGARADEVTLSALADTALYSESDSLSNGAGDYLFAGRTQTPGDPVLRRGLVRFDIAGSIPAGSTIESVELRLHLSRLRQSGVSVSLHPVLADWGEGDSDAGGPEGMGAPAEEGDATWLYRFFDASDPGASPAWSNAGGDFGGSPSAARVLDQEGQAYSWSSPQMATDVQGWLDAPAMNFGWMLIGEEDARGTAVRFNSRSNDAGDTRPELVVEFTPPANSGACELPGGECVIQTEQGCLDAGGTYLGDGSDCPEATGACCLPGGSCVEATAGACEAQDGRYQGDGTDCAGLDCPVVLTPYADPLTVPPVAEPVEGEPGGEATYDMPMVQSEHRVHSELPPTTMWTYAGEFPGPTIVAERGEPVTVNWINELRDAQGNLRTDHLLDVDLCPHGAEDLPKGVVHLHGGHVPADVDGHPEAAFLPGESDTYVYPMDQRAGMLWYHDHALGITRLNNYAGLAGAFLVRDDEEAALDLPEGEHEVPLVIKDRSFNADGSLSYPSSWSQHFFGDFNLVNGTVTPRFEVERATYRFRVLNASNGRTYTLSLSSGMGFDLIGVDGGLLEAPVERTEVTLSPAERADILVDFSSVPAGTSIELVNSAPAPYPGTPGVGVVPEVMRFDVTDEAGPTTPAPATLTPIEPLEEGDAIEHRDFILDRESDPCTGTVWKINGLGWEDITEEPFLGTTEVWRFINPTDTVHPMHMHLEFFQVLDRTPFILVDGEPIPTDDPQPPEPVERGWKDTVKVGPNEMVRVIAHFEDYTGLFVYHCHILEHEDHEMMRQFRVRACTADVTGGPEGPDGVVTTRDFLAYLDLYAAGDPDADITGPGGEPDGQITPSDFLAYIDAFAKPCP